MAASNQQFDFSKATELQGKLKNEISSITDTLNKTQTMVEGVREWWKGGSEEAFIKNFENTKKDVIKGLDKWLAEYQKLIKDVAKTKEEQDNALKKALSN
ncbi:hypothetical protein AGMMS49975_02240 [Clostridia bacterium]|nr:hypothetical protein AGMMS49975_02240 [Clostridia bacterium]